MGGIARKAIRAIHHTGIKTNARTAYTGRKISPSTRERAKRTDE
ncbi:MAG: hypothetical protein R2744_06270 [Bacteroidales bacterium]